MAVWRGSSLCNIRKLDNCIATENNISVTGWPAIQQSRQCESKSWRRTNNQRNIQRDGTCILDPRRQGLQAAPTGESNNDD